MNEEEALRQRELIRGLALELLRTWGFQADELHQLFTNKGSRSSTIEDLEDAVLDAYAHLWGELQSGKVKTIFRETIRGCLLDALRRRGLERKPFTTQRLLLGIAASRKPTTHRRYLQWAKYELQDELKRRFTPVLTPLKSSLEGAVDYFLAEFVPQQYDMNSISDAKAPLFERLCETFLQCESEVRRALRYRPWITPVSPRLTFHPEEHPKLEQRAWTTLEDQPEYQELVTLERLRYQAHLLRGQTPENDLGPYLVGTLDPAERRRLELCLIFSELIRRSNRKWENLKAYMIYVFSHFPSVGRARPPKRVPIARVTLEMIQGCEFTWEEVCRRFPGGPQPGDYTTKRRIERDVIRAAKALGFIQETEDGIHSGA